MCRISERNIPYVCDPPSLECYLDLHERLISTVSVTTKVQKDLEVPV